MATGRAEEAEVMWVEHPKLVSLPCPISHSSFYFAKLGWERFLELALHLLLLERQN
jgi:hypothetical protein